MRSFSIFGKKRKGERIMSKIFNGTPHPITVLSDSCITYREDIRKYVCSGELVVVAEIPSHGVLSAKMDTVEVGRVGDIPVFAKKITGCDPIPEGYDIVVVSALYATAAKTAGLDTSRLYTIGDPVYSEDGRTILGCRGIAKVE